MWRKRAPLVIHGEPVGKLRASWLLCKEAFRFLRADAELVFVPIISGILLVFLFACLLLIVLATGVVNVLSGEALWSTQAVLFVVGGYLLTTFAIVMTQAMVTHTVYERTKSADATLGDSFKAALRRLPSLALWSVIQTTIGLILQAIAERSERLGRMIAGLIGAGWSLLTFFVVPAIMIDNKRAHQALSHSASVFRQTWGESLVTTVSIGVIFLLAHLVMVGLFLGTLFIGMELDQPLIVMVGFVVWVVWLFAALALEHVLRAIIRTLLYVYATADTPPANFDAELLSVMLVRTKPRPDTVSVPAESGSTVTSSI